MGGQTFSQIASGKTAAEAFAAAVEQARHDHGHSGYSGTLAEKDEFIMLKPSADRLAELQTRSWLNYHPDDPDWEKVDDKWGPAGCYDLGNDRFMFFGWASS